LRAWLFFFAPVQRMIAGEIEERLRLLSSNIPDTMIYQLLITPDGCRKFYTSVRQLKICTK
jgi:hypothetical protein